MPTLLQREKSREAQKRYRAKYPDRHAECNKKWIDKNRERYNASKYNYRDRLKEDIIKHYSNGTMACAVCGYSDIRALCLDHINDDGAKWRAENKVAGRGTTGTTTYAKIEELDCPEGLQVLCANCNLVKEIERKMDNRRKNPWYKK